MVPEYTDISRLRAPYKNANIQGFGLVENGGAPPPPPEQAAANPFVETDARGYRFVAKAVQSQFADTMKVYGTTFLGGPYNNVKIYPYSPEILAAMEADPATTGAQMKAFSVSNWIKTQIEAGNVVFMAAGTLVQILSGQPITPGGEMLGTFPAGSDEAKEAAKFVGTVVVGGDPDGKVATAGISPIMIALIAAGVVGGVYVMTRKKKGGRRRAAMMM